MGSGPETRNIAKLHKLMAKGVLFHPCHDDGRDDEDRSRKESPSNGCLFDCLGRELGRRKMRKMSRMEEGRQVQKGGREWGKGKRKKQVQWKGS